MAFREGIDEAADHRVLRLIRQVRSHVGHSVTYAAFFASLSFLLGSFFMTWTIVARKFGLPRLLGSDEVVELMLGVGSAWVMGYALKVNAHIRIDVAFRYIPIPARGYLNVASLFLLTALAVLLAWRSWVMAIISAERGALTRGFLHTPLVWPQGLLAVGFSFFALYAILLLAEAAFELLQGRSRNVAIWLAPASESAEIEQAVADVVQQTPVLGPAKQGGSVRNVRDDPGRTADKQADTNEAEEQRQ